MEGSHGREDRKWRWEVTNMVWNSQGCGKGLLISRGCGKEMVLISCPHTNADRMSKGDRAASLLAAGVHAADEGAGCLIRREVLDEGGEMRDITKLGGVASTGLPDHGRV